MTSPQQTPAEAVTEATRRAREVREAQQKAARELAAERARQTEEGGEPGDGNS